MILNTTVFENITPCSFINSNVWRNALHPLLPLEWSQHTAPNYSKNSAWFQASAMKQIRSVIFSIITQCIVVIPY